jgi:hypothetical protein
VVTEVPETYVVTPTNTATEKLVSDCGPETLRLVANDFQPDTTTKVKETELTTTYKTFTTYVTTCPVTTTKTLEGKTYTETYTTVSTVVSEVPVTKVVTPTETATTAKVCFICQWDSLF